MTWESRLIELVLAGGSLATVSCGGNGGDVPCGNADPDPCICGRPDASAQYAALCDEQKACEAQGGQFDPWTLQETDGSETPPHCISGDGDVSEAGSRDASGDHSVTD